MVPETQVVEKMLCLIYFPFEMAPFGGDMLMCQGAIFPNPNTFRGFDFLRLHKNDDEAILSSTP